MLLLKTVSIDFWNSESKSHHSDDQSSIFLINYITVKNISKWLINADAFPYFIKFILKF